MNDKLKKLHTQYKDIPIPQELEMMIEKICNVLLRRENVNCLFF